jgi:transcriptional regulator with XRE-family HTH domain
MNARPDPIVEELTRRRKAAGVTQMDLASRIGSNQSHVSDIETGKVDPTLRMLMRYARAIGVRVRVEPLLDAVERSAEEALRRRVSQQWAEDWDSPSDAIYDIPPTGMEPPDPFKTQVRM